MSILKIARMGHPVLRGRAAPVADPDTTEIRQLITDMKDTLADAGGVGLAAPQVHVPLRLVIFYVPAIRNGGTAVPLTVLINPHVEPLDESRDVGYESCLSLPGLMGAVPRFSRIRYRGVDGDGQPVDVEAEGFHARVVQHECDHLDGVLYPSHVQDFSRFGFVEEMRRVMEQEQ